MRVRGRANQRYALLFRDYVRAHPGTAAAYGESKRRLAEHLADPADYPDVKDPAVDLDLPAGGQVQVLRVLLAHGAEPRPVRRGPAPRRWPWRGPPASARRWRC